MASSKLNCMMYAGDTTLYFNLEDFDCQNLDNEINSDIEKINLWLKYKKIFLLADKTKYMNFHTNQRMIPPIALSINRKLIVQVSTFNFLGIMLDSNMLWTSHTNLLCMKLSKTIGIIKKKKMHLSEKKCYFFYTIHHLSHTYNMAYYHGDLNITMLKNCKREPLDLPLEVTILHILSLYSN